MSGYYPYLLCGLPELNFNMNPDSFSYQDLYNQIFELLSPADQRLAELFLAFPRNEEVAKAYLPMQAEEEEREEKHDGPCNYMDKDGIPSFVNMLTVGCHSTKIRI